MLWIIMSCYDMSFCNVMMSCYVEVVKQVTVLVVTTCESVNSHLLLSPCTSLELATCTLQKSFPKIYHQFLSVSQAVQPLKRSSFSNFCHFGTENSRFGTIPRILLVLNDPIRNWHPVGASTEVKHRVQGVQLVDTLCRNWWPMYMGFTELLIGNLD